MTKPTKKPIAILISDVHYNLNNLPLADAAMRLAISKANTIGVPLIVAGDLHDTKANMRAECVNAMLETFNLLTLPCYILRGNHCSINEKSTEHALNFLAQEKGELWDDDARGGRTIISKADFFNELGACGPKYNSIHLIAYHHDLIKLKTYLKTIDKGSVVIMHQGLTTSNSGEYIQDPTAITPDDVAGLRVISGHYHTRQTIKLPDGGQWDYIGNPYTQNWAEARDPEKGFQVLYSDGSLEFVPTKLRRHLIFNVDILDNGYWQITGKNALEDGVEKDDLVWVKLTGLKEHLACQDKKTVTATLSELRDKDFKLTLHPLETEVSTTKESTSPTKESIDNVIDNLTNVSEDQKERLKTLWKSL